jgi:hypothetical protein
MKKIVITVSLALILSGLHAQKEGEAFAFSIGGADFTHLKPYGLYGIVIGVDKRADSSVEFKMAYAVWTDDSLFQISLSEYHDKDPADKPFKTWQLKEKVGFLTFVRKKDETDSLWIGVSDYTPGVFGNYWIEFQKTIFFINRNSLAFNQPFKLPEPTNDY